MTPAEVNQAVIAALLTQDWAALLAILGLESWESGRVDDDET